MLTDLAYRLRALVFRTSVERELDEELRAHLDALERKHIAAGLAPAEAARRARIEFGGLEQVAEACRDSRGVSLVETLWADLRYAGRLLRKDFGFNAIAILTLALGIGASTTVFSVVHRVLIERLPYPEAERIVLPSRLPPPGVQLGFDDLPWGRYEFNTFAAETQTFESLGAFIGDGFNLAGMGEPVRLEGVRASAGFFPTLGVAPALGRVFTAREDVPGRDLEVVLGHRVWQQRFGADPAIVGRTINLNGQLYTVIGVMPPGFAFPKSTELPGSVTLPRTPELWVPMAFPAGPARRGEPAEYGVVGRLKRGVTIDRAQAELNLFTRQMEQQFPGGKNWFNMRAKPIQRQIVGDTRRPLLLLLGAVGVVLLIGCANVANLLLARSLAREKELTLRAALGAARGRLIRQLITESVLLSAIGAAVGVVIAWGGVRAVRTFGPLNVPRLGEIAIDIRMVAFALGLALVTGVVFGLVPALGVVRGMSHTPKEASGRVKGGSRDSRLRHAILSAEVALALVLVIASSLLVQTFVRLMRVDGGFRAERVLTFELTLPASRYSGLDRIVPLYTAVLERMRAVPGVESVGIGETIPMGGTGESTGLRIPNRPAAPANERPFANYTVVSPGYFRSVGTPLLQGRDFLPTDVADAPLVAIVNRAMAEKYWPGEDAIGKAVGVPIAPTDMTIVGIVADVKHVSLREKPEPEVYVPYTQKPWPSLSTMHVAARGEGSPAALLSGLRAAVHAVDPDLPLAKIATLSEVVDESVAQPRFSMLLLGAFAALALVLACVGMYGAVSYTVVQRTPELGVRLALGADRRHIFAVVVGEGFRVALAGIAAGLVVAWGAMRLVASFLYGVEATDVATFAAMSAVLLAVAMLASYLPARRAARIDPLIAIRTE